MAKKIEEANTGNTEEAKPQKQQVKPETQKTPQQAPQQPTGKSESTFTEAVPARVEEVIGRTGTRGEALQVRCKILRGRDSDKIIRRNVKGPVRIGDVIMLRETEIEARPLTSKGRR